MNERNDSIIAVIRQLWPSAKLVDEQIIGFADDVKHHPLDDVLVVIRRHRKADLDKTKPSFNEMRATLRKKGGSGRCELAIMLDNWRDVARRTYPPAANWSHADAWESFLAHQTYPITHGTLTGEAKPDPDGDRARRARNERRTWALHYADDLPKIGLEAYVARVDDLEPPAPLQIRPTAQRTVDTASAFVAEPARGVALCQNAPQTKLENQVSVDNAYDPQSPDEIPF